MRIIINEKTISSQYNQNPICQSKLIFLNQPQQQWEFGSKYTTKGYILVKTVTNENEIENVEK